MFWQKGRDIAYKYGINIGVKAWILIIKEFWLCVGSMFEEDLMTQNRCKYLKKQIVQYHLLDLNVISG